MASESDSAAANASSFIENLINSSRNSNVSLFLPFFLSSMTNNPNSSTSVQDSSNPDQETSESTTPSDPFPDRIIMINPFTQSMFVIQTGSSSSLVSLLNGLISNKEGQPPASKESIEGLPSVEICEDDEKVECVVCLDEMGVSGGVVKEMPCKHRFHGECVEKWLKIHGSCPVCRYKMPEEDGELSDKSENGRNRREIWMSFLVGNERRSAERSDDQTDSDNSSSQN
ncbi:unnamed protein product [Withania somnifera]